MDKYLEYQEHLEAVKQFSEAFKQVPEELKTQEMCYTAVKAYGKVFEFVPEELKTSKFCEFAVSRDGRAFKFVPEEFKTAEMSNMAVRKGASLAYVPDKFKTLEICKIAVEETGFSNVLKYVPEELKTLDLCITAIKRTHDEEHAWNQLNDDVPESIRSQVAEAVGIELENKKEESLDNNNLEYQEWLEEQKAWKEKLEDDGLYLEYVPYELRTKEICEIAVTENGHALGFVPEGVMTIELCEIAVRESGEYLYYVPEQFRTFELCEIAVKDSGSWALEFVPKEFKEELAEKYDIDLPEKSKGR